MFGVPPHQIWIWNESQIFVMTPSLQNVRTGANRMLAETAVAKPRMGNFSENMFGQDLKSESAVVAREERVARREIEMHPVRAFGSDFFDVGELTSIRPAGCRIERGSPRENDVFGCERRAVRPSYAASEIDRPMQTVRRSVPRSSESRDVFEVVADADETVEDEELRVRRRIRVVEEQGIQRVGVAELEHDKRVRISTDARGRRAPS